MGILSDSLINTTWDYDLLLAVQLFKRDPSMVNLEHVRNIIEQNCEKRRLKLIWNKHKYIGIDLKSPSLVIAGVNKPYNFCVDVYCRLQGNTWTYDMEWKRFSRTEVPLNQGAYFATFQKFILPDDVFFMLRKNI